MDSNKRPQTMQRITTKELADALQTLEEKEKELEKAQNTRAYCRYFSEKAD